MRWTSNRGVSDDGCRERAIPRILAPHVRRRRERRNDRSRGDQRADRTTTPRAAVVGIDIGIGARTPKRVGAFARVGVLVRRCGWDDSLSDTLSRPGLMRMMRPRRDQQGDGETDRESTETES